MASLAFCLTAAALEPGPAQPRRYADTLFEQLGIDDGLGSPAVTAFAEDGDGFLWIGTQSGVSRWDGYHMRSYPAQPGVAGALPDNMVRALYTDPLGQVWIGDGDGSLVRYDRDTDRFISFSEAPGIPNHGSVEAILTDGGQGLWVCTGAGLEHLDVATGIFRKIPLPSDPAATLDDQAFSLVRSSDGRLWVGTRKGLFHGDVQNRHFAPVKLPGNRAGQPAVFRLLLDREDHVWAGTDHGAYRIESATETVRILRETVIRETDSPEEATPAYGANASLQETAVDALLEVKPGIIWLGTVSQGIVVVDENTWTTRRISHDVAIPSSLADDSVQTMYRDRSGMVWVGTLRGISRSNQQLQGVSTFFGGVNHKGAVSGADVLSILQGRDRSLWLGFNKQGVELWSRYSTRIRALRPDPAHPRTALGNGMVEALAQGPDGMVYIGTQKGLYRVDEVASHLKFIPFRGLPERGITSLLFDKGLLWVGTDRDGLWKLAVSGGSSSIEHVSLRQPLTDNRVTALARGAGNDLWVGTQRGLNRIDESTEVVERILPDPNGRHTLGAALIGSLLFDLQGRLWISTFGGGIYILDAGANRGDIAPDHRDITPDHRDIIPDRPAGGGQPQFQRLVSGLPNENVDKLLQTPDGKIWVSTDDGIAVIDPSTLSVHALQRSDGVAIQVYWTTAGAVGDDGRLAFGGMGGLTVISPNRLRPWTYVPPVVVTDARIGGKPVPESRFNEQLPGDVIVVSPAKNSLEVEFAALDYTAPERNRYGYRLLGFDPDWISTDAGHRLLSYTNLRPGRYTLQLRGSNRDGVWGRTREIRIRVLPAWYRTVWARIGEVLLGLLLVGSLVKLERMRARSRQHSLERQVALRTAELERITAELQESQRKLEQMAYSDSLTGLPNRRMFTECFRRLLALKRRQNGSFALIVVDLDAFKQINDTHGHNAGDEVLNEVARRVGRIVRESDCFARVGGDEFALLLAEAQDIVAIQHLCRTIAACFADPIEFDGNLLSATVSIGAALFPEAGETQDNLYKAADVALYTVKRRGGAGWHLYLPHPSADPSAHTPASPTPGESS